MTEHMTSLAKKPRNLEPENRQNCLDIQAAAPIHLEGFSTGRYTLPNSFLQGRPVCNPNSKIQRAVTEYRCSVNSCFIHDVFRALSEGVG